jgi:superfamily II DNA helicase RecQ
MPLLFRQSGIQIIVTPLNILGKQNTDQLATMGIKAKFLDSKEASNLQNFKVRSIHFIMSLHYLFHLNQDIEDGKYRVIVANPEVLLKSGGGFEKLWKNPTFVSCIISIMWDKAHCISSWANFRPEYKEAGHLQYFLLHHIPYYVV